MISIAVFPAPMVRANKRLAVPLVTALVVVVIWTILALQKASNKYSLGLVFVDSYTHYMMPQEMNLREKAAQTLRNQEIEDPCTVLHPISHQFIDLRELSYVSDHQPTSISWHARAFDDKHRNYTLGVCANPYKNEGTFTNDVNITAVGAYFNNPDDDTLILIGEFSTKPEFHGRKLTLTYNNGLYCENLVDAKTGERIRRTTVLTFTCARDMMARASVHFVAQAHDCTYFFEVRSHHACPMAPKSNNLAAVLIFALILSAAVLVLALVTRQAQKKTEPGKA